MTWRSFQAGAIVTIALACAAVTWALRAWMPWRWAALGGALCALHPLIYWWGQCYFGGGVPLLQLPATVEDPEAPDALGRWMDGLIDALLSRR